MPLYVHYILLFIDRWVCVSVFSLLWCNFWLQQFVFYPLSEWGAVFGSWIKVIQWTWHPNSAAALAALKGLFVLILKEKPDGSKPGKTRSSLLEQSSPAQVRFPSIPAWLQGSAASTAEETKHFMWDWRASLSFPLLFYNPSLLMQEVSLWQWESHSSKLLPCFLGTSQLPRAI